jgi:putative tricarboxylic transport membrane protein
MGEIIGLFQGLANGFGIAFSLTNLTFALIGALLGTAVGVLPGLGPAATIALLLPLSFKIGSPVTSIIMMAGIFYGAMYGGSTTSILVNIPGEAASVVTCIDGYQMALKGRAGPALAIAAIGSFIAGTIGVIGLTFVAPPLAEFAIKFGPPE